MSVSLVITYFDKGLSPELILAYFQFDQNTNYFAEENTFEDIVCKMATTLSRTQCVNDNDDDDDDRERGEGGRTGHVAGLILDLRPANERRRYFVATSFIGRVQA